MGVVVSRLRVSSLYKESPVKIFMQRMWTEDDGVLTFEWILLVTLLVVGIIGGVAAVRDAIIDELGDVAQAVLALDQSYTILHPLLVEVHDASNPGASNSAFIDAAVFQDCNRNDNFNGQTGNPFLDFDSPS
jgi:Flp pilus assembly pilin Flp